MDMGHSHGHALDKINSLFARDTLANGRNSTSDQLAAILVRLSSTNMIAGKVSTNICKMQIAPQPCRQAPGFLRSSCLQRASYKKRSDGRRSPVTPTHRSRQTAPAQGLHVCAAGQCCVYESPCSNADVRFVAMPSKRHDLIHQNTGFTAIVTGWCTTQASSTVPA